MIEKKFLTMLMTVLLVFVLCYLPFQTLYLIYEFNPELGYLTFMQPLSEFLYLIVWLPNALNPVCYGCLNEHYKKAFKALIFRPRRYFQSLRSRHSFSHSATTMKGNTVRWIRPVKEVTVSSLPVVPGYNSLSSVPKIFFWSSELRTPQRHICYPASFSVNYDSNSSRGCWGIACLSPWLL